MYSILMKDVPDLCSEGALPAAEQAGSGDQPLVIFQMLPEVNLGTASHSPTSVGRQ